MSSIGQRFLLVAVAFSLSHCAQEPQSAAVPVAQQNIASTVQGLTTLIPASGNPAALFVEQITEHRIAIFNVAGVQIGSIKTAIGSLATDREGNLYVAPSDNGDSVEIYAPPYSNAPKLLRINGQSISGVAVDERRGIFAVISASSRGGGGNTRASFFRHGEQTPCQTVVPPNGTMGLFGNAAFNRDGVLFAESLLPNSLIAMVSFSGECGATTGQLLTFEHSLFSAGDMAFNANNKLVLQAYPSGNPGPIYTYDAPKNGVFSAPIATTNLQPAGGYTPIFFTMSSDGKHVWADYVMPNISMYDYPAGGAPVKSIPVQSADGAAVFPPLVP